MERKRRKILSKILLTGGFILCGLIILYPLISNYLYDKRQDTIITSYEASVKELDTSELNAELERCREYNKRLAEKSSVYAGKQSENVQFTEGLGEAEEEYLSRMTIGGSEVMGYVKIPKIGVYLSVYHGTSEEALQNGLGHLKESSLPVGGESTHAVITGHSGTTNKTLFTDLDQLTVGDHFFLSVLGEVLVYQVDQIEVVLPYEVESLEIQKGQDYVTLLTCTPYGVNTHRLLVRGARVGMTEELQSLFEGDGEVINVETTQSEQEKESFSTFYGKYLDAVKSGAVAACAAVAVCVAASKWKRHCKQRNTVDKKESEGRSS